MARWPMVELRYCPVCRSYLYDGVPDLDQPLCLALHQEHYIHNKGHSVHISYYNKETQLESPMNSSDACSTQ